MLGKDCYSNPAILNASSGVGHVINIGGLNSYVTGSPLSILAILLVPDIFGNRGQKKVESKERFGVNSGKIHKVDFMHGRA